MLAAMPTDPPTTPNQGEPVIRDRGDACPGALRLHSADDGRLARLRLPAGLLTARQVEVLAAAAEELGDGRVSVTSRGNVELRGLGESCGAELAGRLAEAGLLPSATHERVRNVVASPTAGLDGLGCADVQLWARELDALLCAESAAAALSGRFLFVLDDGREDVAGLGGDVTLLAGERSVRLRMGAQVFLVAAPDAPRAALAAAGAFLEAARAAGNGAWRVRELPEGVEPDVSAALTRAGIPAHPAATRATPTAPSGTATPATASGTAPHTASGGPAPHPASPETAPRAASGGPLPGVVGRGGRWGVSVGVRLGRLTAAQLRALAPGAGGELRLTPWRGAVLTGFDSRPAAQERLDALAAAGLVTRPDDPWAGVGACTGRPGCAKSLADVRADATPRTAGLPVHFSGCDRRCGHPQGAPGTWVDVVATADGGYLVDGRPTPRTDLTAAVAEARGPSTHTR
ncbi:cobalamin biosynthesis protein CobG [Streptomyces sp. Je 1-79]|uniref:cobalamin biosynthesis protein CobG n=1 Tax=Streptomyces sp. Je 1-79 TaxID=2943847 RepID=UPI0021A71594|nr:cobalamin biosynthesis protein CobG [Streptomyces sp. Je 1-79]MCT4354752.1 cobalamin biosynthesis protein CobG [Streptomyces sp. Je 1-79]